MIRGIDGKPYIGLDEFIDIDTFDLLQPEIYKGLSLAREYAKEGTWMRPGFDQTNGSYIWNWKPIYKALDEYLALPNDHPIKIGGWDLYTNIKDYKTRNYFTRYLKIAMGAYDPYIYYFLWEEGSWDDRTAVRKLTEEAKFFPKTVSWVEQMIKDNIFEHIGRVIFFHCDHDGMPFEHRDLDGKNGIFKDNEYSSHRNEYIHIRPNTKKPFYIWDPETQNKYYINSKAAWWNDQDWHGGNSIKEQSYALRIDGKFSEEFRKKIKINHLDSY